MFPRTYSEAEQVGVIVEHELMRTAPVFTQTRINPSVDQAALKRLCGIEAAQDVKDGMIVGLGTGSTVHHTIVEIGRRIADEGMKILGVPTSIASEKLAIEVGIPLTDLDANPALDLTIDGADEFDAHRNLIKGGGGALTREKIVAHASKRMVVVADESKEVELLGSTFALPVEVIGLGKQPVLNQIESLGAKATFRTVQHGLSLTDNGNPIIDAKWDHIEAPLELERTLNMIPGVVECGLFLGMCDQVVVARADGVERV